MNKEFEKLVIHISGEMAQNLASASEKMKLSRGSVIRKALEEFFANNAITKNKKGA